VWHPELSVLLDCAVGDDCVIHAPVWIGHGVVIGDRCRVQAFAFIPSGVMIGNDVFIGPSVTFTNDKHPPSVNWLPTVVCNGASIGAGAVILPGIVIGERAVIGAGSVVTRDVPPHTTVMGNPAR
jgi:acetyltransferase-like isoleucine patch superfamily enzyme